MVATVHQMIEKPISVKKNPAGEVLHFVWLDFLFQKTDKFFCAPGKRASVRVADDQLPGCVQCRIQWIAGEVFDTGKKIQIRMREKGDPHTGSSQAFGCFHIFCGIADIGFDGELGQNRVCYLPQFLSACYHEERFLFQRFQIVDA